MKTKEVIDPKKVEETMQALRTLGKKIVLTQGVFDMFHVGHLRYLNKAKEQGDVLVIGLDSDALTQSRKGPQRPVVPQDERTELMLGIECVDYIVIREINGDIDYLAKQIKPDILVISNSTKDFPDFENEMRKKLKDYCGNIVCFDTQADTSTSAKITKIVQAGNIEKLQELGNDLGQVFQKHGLIFKSIDNEK